MQKVLYFSGSIFDIKSNTGSDVNTLRRHICGLKHIVWYMHEIRILDLMILNLAKKIELSVMKCLLFMSNNNKYILSSKLDINRRASFFTPTMSLIMVCIHCTPVPKSCKSTYAYPWYPHKSSLLLYEYWILVVVTS